MDTWVVIWVLIALLCIVGEVMTTGLFLGSVSAAAAITAIAAFFVPLGVQGALFAAISLLAIGVVRPFVSRAFGVGPSTMTSPPQPYERLVGKRAVVTQRVDAAGGQVRVGQGEFWSALPSRDTGAIEPGTPVEILRVDGLIAIVSPVAGYVAPPARSAEEQEKGTVPWTP